MSAVRYLRSLTASHAGAGARAVNTLRPPRRLFSGEGTAPGAPAPALSAARTRPAPAASADADDARHGAQPRAAPPQRPAATPTRTAERDEPAAAPQPRAPRHEHASAPRTPEELAARQQPHPPDTFAPSPAGDRARAGQDPAGEHTARQLAPASTSAHEEIASPRARVSPTRARDAPADAPLALAAPRVRSPRSPGPSAVTAVASAAAQPQEPLRGDQTAEPPRPASLTPSRSGPREQPSRGAARAERGRGARDLQGAVSVRIGAIDVTVVGAPPPTPAAAPVSAPPRTAQAPLAQRTGPWFGLAQR